MENTKVTFENEDGSKKAVVSIIPKGSEIAIKISFEPEVNANDSDCHNLETYAIQALYYFNTLIG